MRARPPGSVWLRDRSSATAGPGLWTSAPVFQNRPVFTRSRGSNSPSRLTQSNASSSLFAPVMHCHHAGRQARCRDEVRRVQEPEVLPGRRCRLLEPSGRGHVMGVYSMLPDSTCWFLAVDFDKATWTKNMRAFIATCRKLDLPFLDERSTRRCSTSTSRRRTRVTSPISCATPGIANPDRRVLAWQPRGSEHDRSESEGRLEP